MRCCNRNCDLSQSLRSWPPKPFAPGALARSAKAPQPATDQSGGLYRLVNGEQDGRGQNSAQMRTRRDAACAICRMVCQPVQARDCGTRVGTTIGERCRPERNGQRSHAQEFRRLWRPRYRTGRRPRRFRSLPAGSAWVSADFPTIKSRRCEWIACKFIPVKRIFRNANYLGEIWRWPVDHAAAFSFGLELVLIGIFFIPIDLWIASGDFNAVRRHVGVEVSRFVASFWLSSAVCRAASSRWHFGASFARYSPAARAILTARTFPGPAVGEIPFRVQTRGDAAAAPRPRCPRAHRLQKNYRQRLGMVQAGDDGRDDDRDALNAGALLPKNRDCDMSQPRSPTFFRPRGGNMPSEFADKVAVITGGSRGIGREIAVEFARAGAQTVIVSSSAANLAAASKTVAAAGGPAPRRDRGGPAQARRLPAGVRGR